MHRVRAVVKDFCHVRILASLQFKTLNGFVLREWNAADVTATLRCAVVEHGSKRWWEAAHIHSLRVGADSHSSCPASKEPIQE